MTNVCSMLDALGVQLSLEEYYLDKLVVKVSEWKMSLSAVGYP